VARRERRSSTRDFGTGARQGITRVDVAERNAAEKPPTGTGNPPLGPAGLSLAHAKHRTIVCLRGLLLIALGGILIESGAVSAGSAGLTLLVLHAISNVALLSAPLRRIRFLQLELAVGATDVVFVAVALLLYGYTGGVLPISCLMMALVVALGHNRFHVSAGAIAVAALHAWLILGDPAEPVRQLGPQLLFLGAIALHFGYLAAGIHSFRRESEAVHRERREQTTLLEILDAIASSIDLREVTWTIVNKLAQIVPSARCSMLLINDADERCYVIASHDDPDVDMLELDLGKYPEIRQAIETHGSVLIRDVADDPLMREFRAILAKLDLHSIMVIPVVFGGDVLGTLCLRASRARHEFSQREIQFCTAVARASANALKNAMLHRQVHEESRRHRALSEKLSRILDHSPGLILTTDNEGRITSLNAGAVRLLGYAKSDVLGRPCEMLLGDETGRRLLELTRSTGKISDYACRLRKRDGRSVDVEINVSVLEDEAGEVTGSVWLGRDVSELKATQTQLLQAKKLSTIGEVISGVAHELNNPLSGVLGFSELLLLRAGDENIPQELEMIHDSALRCRKIVQNLLSFARENKPERKYEDVNAVIEKTLEMKKYQLHVNSIEIACELDRALPRTLIDFHQMQQVLLNLINNAQHAMTRHRQAVPSRLHVRSTLAAGAVLIEITDNGEGMDQETLERIFDPFFTTREPGKGTGLGLSVSYGIVKEHGGRIWARSNKGEGSTFLIELPVRKEDGVAALGDQEGHRVSEPTIRPGSRILVVDDEPVVLQLFVNLFEGRGYKVDTAVNGTQAYDSVRVKSYDLVITDLRMPEMDGVELYGKLLERRPELEGSVIFITGDIVDRDTARFLADAGVPMLCKPIEIPKMVKLVDEMLAHPASAYST
jgi:PAS domain S-box-containing protein